MKINEAVEALKDGKVVNSANAVANIKAKQKARQWQDSHSRNRGPKMQVNKTLDSDEISKAITEYMDRAGLKVTAIIMPVTEGDMEIEVIADVIAQLDTKEHLQR